MESSEKNFKFTIEYLGTNYNGWQLQPDCYTVQGEIEKALKQILYKNHQVVNLTGSGRTDSGRQSATSTQYAFLGFKS